MLRSKQVIPRVILFLSVVLVTTAGEINIPSSVKSDEPVERTQDIQNEDSKHEISEEIEKLPENGDKFNTYHACLGCPLDLNVDAEGVSTLIDTALKHLESERDEKHVLIKVHRLQQQVVAGIKYILLVEVAPTVCVRNSELSSCPIDQNKRSLFCRIEYLEKPWVNLSKNVVKNNCTMSQEFMSVQKQPVIEKDERQITDDFLADLESQILPESNSAEPPKHTYLVNDIDGPVRKEPDFIIHQEDGFVNRIPEFIPPQTYMNEDNVVTDAVVDGQQLQDPSVFNRDEKVIEYDSFKDIEEIPRVKRNAESDDDDKDHSFRLRRDLQDGARNKRAQIAGGIFNQPTDHPRLKEYLNDALLHLDSHSSHANRYKIKEILEASSQVVSGSLWRIKARVILSDCDKSHKGTVEECGELQGAKSSICNFRIWDQPWLPQGRLTNITCDDDKLYSFRLRRDAQDDEKKKQDVLGAITNQPTDHPSVTTYLYYGLRHLDSHSTHPNRYKIKEVLEATSQVVSGELWRIKARVVLSDCSKCNTGPIVLCGELQGAPIITCEFKVLDQPWIPEGRETNITCDDDDKTHSFRLRRDLQDSEDDDFRSQEIVEDLFAFYTKNFNKKYVNRLEYNFRLMVFRDNLETIRLLNKHEQGTATYGLTKFADLTREEFSRSRGLRPDLRQDDNEIPFQSAIIPDVELPTEFDWRRKNAVTKVKDQGMCGSCWAFSVTGNVEGQAAIKYGKLQEFSEQELVDCDKLDEGCNGGLMDNAYRTLEKMGGLESEGDYPYDAADEKCHFDKSKVRVRLSGAVNISHDETDMAKWLVQNGPISIAINANAMQFYVGGVSHPWWFTCNPGVLDHGVLIVGYGVHTYPKFNKTLPYWIVKNSWGESWGEQGYYRVYRGDGTCGLNQTPSSAIVA